MRSANSTGGRPTLLMRLALRQERGRAEGRRLSRVLVGGTVLVGGSLTAGMAAYAYFTASGTGIGQGRAATVTNLIVTATVGTITNPLYPGAAGDVVLQISNPNSFPVTITAVSLPSATTYATGYTNFSGGAFTSPISGCDSTSSLVTWNYVTGTNPHALANSLTVGANGSLTVTMTKDAAMGTSAPAACEGAYFSMPSLAGLTATSSNSTATSSPATDSWTN